LERKRLSLSTNKSKIMMFEKERERTRKRWEEKRTEIKNKISGICATEEWRSGEAYKRKHKGKAYK